MPIIGNGLIKSHRPTAWYLAGGVAAANCVAAYQPKGAVSLAASYINLSNPGTYNATPGTAPTFDAGIGWSFATNKYLKTGIIPSSVNWSILIRISNATAGNVVGSLSNPGTLRSLQILPYVSNQVQYGNGGNLLLSVAPGVSSGVLGIAGKQAYRNGVSDGTISAGTGLSTCDLYIGTLNVNNAAYVVYYFGNVQAVSIYNVALTASQVAAISAAMAAL